MLFRSHVLFSNLKSQTGSLARGNRERERRASRCPNTRWFFRIQGSAASSAADVSESEPKVHLADADGTSLNSKLSALPSQSCNPAFRSADGGSLGVSAEEGANCRIVALRLCNPAVCHQIYSSRRLGVVGSASRGGARWKRRARSPGSSRGGRMTGARCSSGPSPSLHQHTPPHPPLPRSAVSLRLLLSLAHNCVNGVGDGE